MDSSTFIRLYPCLYHMAHVDALTGILRHGLRSTSSLLDLFEISGEERAEIETQMRRNSVVITHPVHGQAVIRDQKPIGNDRRLAKALGKSATPEQWHLLLNSRVFFWVSRDRFDAFRNARAYRNSRQLLLILDTKKVVAVTGKRLWLSTMNSGACMPFAHPRTPGIFSRLDDGSAGTKSKVAECAIDDRLDSIKSLLVDTKIIPPIPKRTGANSVGR